MSNVIENVVPQENISNFSYFEISKLEINYENEIPNSSNEKEIYLPITIFAKEYLSGLESISRYLIEEIGLKYCQIGKLLNRNERTIWGAHNSSKKKLIGTILKGTSEIKIPLSIFNNRAYSVLEILIQYLKEEYNLRFCKIARMLNRDDRTIWTAYNRMITKRNLVKYGN